MSGVLLLDGPLGTQLEARGVPTPLPGWSAHALDDAPDVVSAIHRDYAAAGARVLTTNTFRTRRAVFGERWEELARRAVRLAREAAGPGQRVVGSIAPLADCYRPDLSPADGDPEGTRAEHRALARVLADAGCDVLQCQTFPHTGEAAIALEEALATGLEAWVSWCPGPHADLLTPAQVGVAAGAAARAGAAAVMVNCLPADSVLPHVRAMVAAVGERDVLVGAYANSGCVDDGQGWRSADVDARAYVERARTWVAAGARVLGACCGAGPDVIAALARADFGLPDGR